MARFDLDADQAFAVLLRISSAANNKLRDAAAKVARSLELPGGAKPRA